MSTNAIPYLDTIVSWSDNLMGAPAAALVFFLCLAAGLGWKIIHVLPNRFIPVVVMLTGSVLLPVLLWKEDAKLAHHMRIAVIGFIIGCVAWLVLRVGLKQLETRLGTNLTDEDTMHFTKPKPPHDDYDPHKPPKA